MGARIVSGNVPYGYRLILSIVLQQGGVYEEREQEQRTRRGPKKKEKKKEQKKHTQKLKLPRLALAGAHACEHDARGPHVVVRHCVADGLAVGAPDGETAIVCYMRWKVSVC